MCRQPIMFQRTSSAYGDGTFLRVCMLTLTKIHLLCFLAGFLRRCSNIAAGAICFDLLKRRAPFKSSLAEPASLAFLPFPSELSLLLPSLDEWSGRAESVASPANGENAGVSSPMGTMPFTESLHSAVVSTRSPFFFQHNLPSSSTMTK